MNPSREERDEPSSEGASSSRSAVDSPCERELAADSCSSTSGESPQDTMKRAAAKRLIERYFYQLVDGCGNSHCSNKFCASSGETRNLTPNEAAAEAIKLFYKEAKLCDSLPTKVPRTGSSPSVSTSAESSASKAAGSSVRGNGLSGQKSRDAKTRQSVASEGCSSVNQTLSTSQTIPQVDGPCNNKGGPLTEERLCQLCKDCLETNVPEPLIVALGEAIGQPHILARCFPGKVNNDNKSERETHGDEHSKSEKPKELREVGSSSDPDKDVDSVTGPGLDIAACKRAFKCLSQVPSHYYDSIILTALTILSENLKLDLRITKSLSMDDVVNCFLIAFETPVFSQSEHMDVAVQTMCRAAVHLPVKGQAKLARMWALHCKDSLRNILVCLQQFITLRVVSTTYAFSRCIQRDEAVVMATKVMKILYYANMMAGVMEPSTLREEPIELPIDPLGDALEHLYPLKHLKQPHPEDPLGVELEVNALDSRKPHLPFEDFYNEPLCDNVEMDKDFSFYKSEFGGCRHTEFSFLLYPFILTAGTKSLGLYYDNRIRMYSERRASMLHAVVGAAQPVPFLRLKVRRTHIIDDALVELEVISMERAVDLKKQLVVEFEGEQGVDEGGVSKEFFQLVVEEIFNPDYGMFTDQPDSHTVWFNPTSFETEAQFTLIGIVLGLAIYNNVILAVNFPMVVYRKLLGKKGSFEDLADWNPVLYNSLKSMLEYQGSDMEEVFVQTFRICYRDVFGNNIFHELKPDGDSILVNQENKQEFVDLYSDFLLNKSVETQFRAFRRGFVMVTDESPLGAWFRPEELETLVCGSKNFDFNELEKSTEYDGGYTSETQIVKDFWSIVHDLTLEDKRKLLQFTTGSDRVPIGGLSHLKLIIARNGPDCDRLPTAHTCFNVLLLPEYDTKEKLNDRLMKAISYSKGFGML